MHDLISFSVSQMTLLDTPSEFRYVSDGSSSCTLRTAGRQKSSPTRRPVRDMYSMPTTMLWNFPPWHIFLNPMRVIWWMQRVMPAALARTTRSVSS